MKINNIELKANQVWRTKSGNLALIVSSGETLQDGETLGFLWFDETDKEYTMSPIWNRLEYLSDFSMRDFWRLTCPENL